MSAYINQLNKDLAAQAQSSQPSSLERKFRQWYGSLPVVARDRPFAMAELEAALNTEGRYIGPILVELGWSRRRLYKTGGSYSRYWVPPSALESR